MIVGENNQKIGGKESLFTPVFFAYPCDSVCT